MNLGEEFQQSFQVRRDDLARYATAAGDANPIHLGDEAAQALGLPGVVAHGMLTLGLALRLVVEALPPGWWVNEYSTRFARPVVVPQHGTQLQVSAQVHEMTQKHAMIGLTVTVQGAEVLTKATAKVTHD